MSEINSPRPRLFEFCTGAEIDVDRYISLDPRGATVHIQTRAGYLRVEFDTAELMRSEVERMRKFRDARVNSDAAADEFDRIYVGALCATDPQVVLVPPDWTGPVTDLGAHAATARWSVQRDGDEWLVGLRDEPSESGPILPSLQTMRWRVPGRAVEMLLTAIAPQVDRVADEHR